jgi:hypothetical protein
MSVHKRKSAGSGYAKRSLNHKSVLVPVTFAALPEDINRWKKAAAAEGRSFAWWIRDRLLSMDKATEKRDQEILVHAEQADGRSPS